MQLPLFYTDQVTHDDGILQLNEETAKHVIQVLRMKNSERFHLTDGKGNIVDVVIVDDHKKKTTVKIEARRIIAPAAGLKTIAISLLKHNNRFEWFLEKAAEMGINTIQPLLCERTEKQHFRLDRMNAILISAMLQSQQAWLTTLREPISFTSYLGSREVAMQDQKFIAHCIDDNSRRFLPDALNHTVSSHLVLIGPEGDFSGPEINTAIQLHFVPVTLGNNRLRTETAGMVAAAFMMAGSRD